MEGLFDITTILWHVLNAAILFVAVYFLLYKPVRSFLKKREDSVNAKLDDADQRREEAQRLLQQGDEALQNARLEAESSVSQGLQQAQTRAEKILADADEQAKQIVQRAKDEAELIRKNAHDAMVDESAQLAVLIAEKLLSREVTPADDQKLIDQLLNNVEERHA